MGQRRVTYSPRAQDVDNAGHVFLLPALSGHQFQRSQAVSARFRTPDALSASGRLRLACDARFSQRFEMAKHAANIGLQARKQRECANGLEDRHSAAVRHATTALTGGLQ